MPTFAAVAILVAVLVGAQIYFGNFVTPRTMSALLLDNAYLLILAVGMTFVIVTSGIDLAVGSVMAFTGIWLAEMLAGGTSALIAIPTILAGWRGGVRRAARGLRPGLITTSSRGKLETGGAGRRRSRPGIVSEL